MHRFSPSLFLLLALTAVAIPARAAEGAQPAQAQQGKRVWTTDDMEDLRARGLISIVGPAEEAVPVAAAVPTPSLPVTVYSSPNQDPAWYADQATELRAQLDARMTALLQARDGLAQARSLRQTTAGINLSQANAGVTPEAGIANLEAQVREVQSRFDELAGLARRNDIAPGVLRPFAV